MTAIVYTPGVWDLLHVGHVSFLERARALGDRLIVGVPSDDVVLKDKHQPPVIPLDDRMQMLSALRCVDLVLPYYQLEFTTHLRMLKPDILVVGQTWGTAERHIDAEVWVQQNHRRIVKLPYTIRVSTTSIQEQIRERAASTS